MLGCNLVILWLFSFSIISYAMCSYLNLDSVLLQTIFVWTLFMVFVAIFEAMLLFYYKYLENKGTYYYDENKCYWNEDNSLSDIFSYKMYMDLYADYSLSDKRYCDNLEKKEGCRFVLQGELIHGLFCFIMSAIIMYFYFFDFNNLSIYLSSIVFSSIQFALIVWYLSTVFVEMYYVKNEKLWWYPLLWNVPWVIIPPYIIYAAIKEITSSNV
jgi:hypothetical protein